MIRRHVLAALAAGIEAGDDDAARAQIRRVDYIVRRAAKKKLESALIDAALATNELDSTNPESVRHVQRVAALQVAKSPLPDDITDHDRVAAAYRTLPLVKAGGAPIATVIACVLGALAIAGITFAIALRPPKGKRSYKRPLPPPAAGAFKDGGVPLPDAEIEKLFKDELTDLVLESDRDRQSGGMDKDRKAHSDALLEAPAMVSKGPALAKAWKDMLGMLDRWVSVPMASREFERIARDFRHRVRDVSDQLAAAGVGYYLEGDVMIRGSGAANALIYSYRVEEVVFVQARRGADGISKPRRVLSLRRLDQINLVHTLLGMQSTELGDPVLLLDQIDQHVATKVLPVLEPEASYPLGDDAYAKTDGRRISQLAGTAIRDEIARALGKDAAAAHAIATLLGERGKLIEEWREVMDAKGWRFGRTNDLFLPEGLVDSMEGHVTNAQRDRAKAIDEELARLEAPRIASLVHQMVAGTVRRHEAQHGIDDDREEPLRYPKQLSEFLGEETEDEDGEPLRYIESARAELSAYISQVANDPTTTHLSLWNVARYAFDDDQVNSSEFYAGVLLLEGLARHLKVPSPGPVIHDRRVDRDRLLQIATPIVVMPSERLRTAATALWKELYAEDLTVIVDK
ncbi:MAG: hypothetical protein ACKV2T_34965 [Kofleriaceae bacterium]